jgi:hypothetical protein
MILTAPLRPARLFPIGQRRACQREVQRKLGDSLKKFDKVMSEFHSAGSKFKTKTVRR